MQVSRCRLSSFPFQQVFFPFRLSPSYRVSPTGSAQPVDPAAHCSESLDRAERGLQLQGGLPDAFGDLPPISTAVGTVPKRLDRLTLPPGQKHLRCISFNRLYVSIPTENQMRLVSCASQG